MTLIDFVMLPTGSSLNPRSSSGYCGICNDVLSRLIVSKRIDGSGHTRGLKGDEILIEARIIPVADAVGRVGLGFPLVLLQCNPQQKDRVDLLATIVLYDDDPHRKGKKR